MWIVRWLVGHEVEPHARESDLPFRGKSGSLSASDNEGRVYRVSDLQRSAFRLAIRFNRDVSRKFSPSAATVFVAFGCA